MSGLRRLCRAFGGMTVMAGGTETRYVWDYVADKPVPESEMRTGSERWAASERKRWGALRDAADAERVSGGGK